jgi:RNA polymerase-binding transcription factor
MNAELTSGVLVELRALLEQRRARLTSANMAERTAEGAGDTPETDASTEPKGDLGDVSVDQQAWDAGHQELLDSETLLAEVEHALSKFALGTYGVCEECGRPIPVARLRVMPEARYDVAHEVELEAEMGNSAEPHEAE